MALGGIYKDKDLEDLYKTDIDEEESTEREIRRDEDVRETEKRVVIKEKKREAPPRMEDEEVESLKRISPEIIGSLFDRVKFLRERIDEISDMMKSREEIHQNMIKDIDIDISEKEELANRIKEWEDRRNIKLDISVLRKEKRSEIRQYWRDLMELRTELQELMEKLRNEQKIADMFKDGAEDIEEFRDAGK